MEFLSAEEIESIHNALVDFFQTTADPISPAGVRDNNLFQSAIGRQHTGFDGKIKYDDPRENAATLLYGICMDHPFYNGNKRTALVSALVHLEKNHYIPKNVSHDDFYEVVIHLADHKIHLPCKAEARAVLGRKPTELERIQTDDEVKIFSRWLIKNTRLVNKSEHPITFRQLRRILPKFGCVFGQSKKNFIDITREVKEFGKFFLFDKVKITTYRTQLSYSGDGQTVGVDGIKKIRRDLHLDESEGIDSEIFYQTHEITDRILNDYRNLLKKLART